VTAVTTYLDSIYSVKEQFLTEDGELKKNLPRDEKAEEFVKSVQKDAKDYEIIRRKLIDGDFNLSLLETTRVALAFTFMSVQSERLIKQMISMKEIADSLVEQLMQGTENVDFSQEI
jgi:hypothetical protein